MDSRLGLLISLLELFNDWFDRRADILRNILRGEPLPFCMLIVELYFAVPIMG